MHPHLIFPFATSSPLSLRFYSKMTHIKTSAKHKRRHVKAFWRKFQILKGHSAVALLDELLKVFQRQIENKDNVTNSMQKKCKVGHLNLKSWSGDNGKMLHQDPWSPCEPSPQPGLKSQSRHSQMPKSQKHLLRARNGKDLTVCVDSSHTSLLLDIDPCESQMSFICTFLFRDALHSPIFVEQKLVLDHLDLGTFWPNDNSDPWDRRVKKTRAHFNHKCEKTGYWKRNSFFRLLNCQTLPVLLQNTWEKACSQALWWLRCGGCSSLPVPRFSLWQTVL